ncbi:hypothetical protein C2G38_2099057 [Gigaspora rosea]|uniref:Uncharacterized protein n=1 Tax=Gigaspora rosea TaxID=44941 RepID=A0A397UWM4_9GLOM|nr:hypothetical protein C2G38_2099057 [Gigaspora rosea]
MALYITYSICLFYITIFSIWHILSFTSLYTSMSKVMYAVIFSIELITLNLANVLNTTPNEILK